MVTLPVGHAQQPEAVPVAVVGAHRALRVQLPARAAVDVVGHVAAAAVEELALDVAEEHAVDAGALGHRLEALVVGRAGAAGLFLPITWVNVVGSM